MSMDMLTYCAMFIFCFSKEEDNNVTKQSNILKIHIQESIIEDTFGSEWSVDGSNHSFETVEGVAKKFIVAHIAARLMKCVTILLFLSSNI